MAIICLYCSELQKRSFCNKCRGVWIRFGKKLMIRLSENEGLPSHEIRATDLDNKIKQNKLIEEATKYIEEIVCSHKMPQNEKNMDYIKSCRSCKLYHLLSDISLPLPTNILNYLRAMDERERYNIKMEVFRIFKKIRVEKLVTLHSINGRWNQNRNGQEQILLQYSHSNCTETSSSYDMGSLKFSASSREYPLSSASPGSHKSENSQHLISNGYQNLTKQNIVSPLNCRILDLIYKFKKCFLSKEYNLGALNWGSSRCHFFRTFYSYEKNHIDSSGLAATQRNLILSKFVENSANLEPRNNWLISHYCSIYKDQCNLIDKRYGTTKIYCDKLADSMTQYLSSVNTPQENRMASLIETWKQDLPVDRTELSLTYGKNNKINGLNYKVKPCGLNNGVTDGLSNSGIIPLAQLNNASLSPLLKQNSQINHPTNFYEFIMKLTNRLKRSICTIKSMIYFIYTQTHMTIPPELETSSNAQSLFDVYKSVQQNVEILESVRTECDFCLPIPNSSCIKAEHCQHKIRQDHLTALRKIRQDCYEIICQVWIFIILTHYNIDDRSYCMGKSYYFSLDDIESQLVFQYGQEVGRSFVAELEEISKYFQDLSLFSGHLVMFEVITYMKHDSQKIYNEYFKIINKSPKSAGGPATNLNRNFETLILNSINEIKTDQEAPDFLKWFRSIIRLFHERVGLQQFSQRMREFLKKAQRLNVFFLGQQVLVNSKDIEMPCDPFTFSSYYKFLDVNV